MVKVKIITTDYLRSHGHEPRGRGDWAFRIGNVDAETTWINGSYGDAVSQIRALAAAKAERCMADEISVHVMG